MIQEAKAMTLKPLADRVVLKQTKAEEKTKGGIILTSASQEKPEVYEVLVVGPGGMVDGKEVKMEVKAGDKVLMGKYSGTTVKLDGEEYTIVRQNDILAIVQ
jgi:chaperonin GroES